MSSSYYENVPRRIKEVPGYLKRQAMREETVVIEPRSLAFVDKVYVQQGSRQGRIHAGVCL